MDVLDDVRLELWNEAKEILQQEELKSSHFVIIPSIKKSFKSNDADHWRHQPQLYIDGKGVKQLVLYCHETEKEEEFSDSLSHEALPDIYTLNIESFGWFDENQQSFVSLFDAFKRPNSRCRIKIDNPTFETLKIWTICQVKESSYTSIKLKKYFDGNEFALYCVGDFDLTQNEKGYWINNLQVQFQRLISIISFQCIYLLFL
jgi:hypothetical protein